MTTTTQRGWTQDEREAIFDSIWKTSSAECPVDGTSLRTKGVELYVDNYLIQAACPRCGNSVWMGPKDDPLGESFRPWTDAEKAQIGDDVIDRKWPRCPVDGTRLETETSPQVGPKTWVDARCRRCDQKHRESFPRA
ncbi:MAG: hypothetical protein AB7T63_00290 [Planctomycetota bacterium]